MSEEIVTTSELPSVRIRAKRIGPAEYEVLEDLGEYKQGDFVQTLHNDASGLPIIYRRLKDRAEVERQLD